MFKKRGMNTIWHDEFGDFPFDHKRFWSKERAAVKQSIQAELQSEMFDASNNTFDSGMCKEKPKNLQRPQSKLGQDFPS